MALIGTMRIQFDASRSKAKGFFLVGTILSVGTFLVLTAHSFAAMPAPTNDDKLAEQVKHGKEL
jgi:hypothetical protein